MNANGDFMKMREKTSELARRSAELEKIIAQLSPAVRNYGHSGYSTRKCALEIPAERLYGENSSNFDSQH